MASTIVPQLEAVGLLSAAAHQVSDTYLKAAQDLHAVCEASLRNAYWKASNHEGRVLHADFQAIYKALNDAYARQTGVWASHALTSARDAVDKAKTTARPTKEKKPVFNYEYTPLLEKYFEYNAYPSAPDKAVLARKSMMTPRQIEVWFQNHRNRARKDGKTLRKLSETPLPIDLPLKSLEDEMPFFAVPVDERKSSNNSENMLDEPFDNEDLPSTVPSISAPQFTSDTDPLDPPRPPCAFPTVYTPCDVNPFNTQSGVYKFPPPLWYRKPATHIRLIQTRIDMNELALELSQKLHLRVPASKNHYTSQPWCTSRYIPWCPAPHPALVQSSRVSLRSHVPTKQIQVIPASAFLQHPLRSSSPLLLTTSVQLRTSSVTPPRKAAGLPTRIPKLKSLVYRCGTPAISEGSPEPARLATSSSSRVSSNSSDMTSQRPSSLSSSSSSSSPTTSILSSSLPGGTSVVSVSGVEFDYPDDLVDNANNIAPSVEKSFSFSVDTQLGFDAPAHPSWNHIHQMHDSPSRTWMHAYNSKYPQF
ncbi:hypothetical protein C0995_015192 [Termitomyces sp. Mi166|nr:hypothetical protein C0995_015192 [Termitomyces sp. Mi166\